MKIPLQFFPLAFAFLSGTAGLAQNNPPAKPSSVARADSDGTKDLKPNELNRLKVLLTEANADLNAGKSADAYLKIAEAERIAPDSFMVQNLMGAVHVKQRHYEEAKKCFARAKELNPTAYEPVFNAAELEFVQGNFAGSKKVFEDILKSNPKLMQAMRHLLLYKILLCEMKLGKMDAANEILKNFTYLDDTPAYYFSHVALSLHLKKDAEAQEWLNRTNAIYKPEESQFYLDSLIELGLVPSVSSPVAQPDGQAPPN